MNEIEHNHKPDLNAPIGVFDSGVGGLTVVREIIRNLPEEQIVYFGDTARVPYGSKSKETILKYSRQIIRFLQTKGVKAIVVACNTASAFALEEVKKELDLPIIGVIKPGAKVAVKTTKNGRVGVIGTEGTVKSHMYKTFIQTHNEKIQVIEKACPLFVPLVEEGLMKDSVTVEMAHRYLKDLRESHIDTLILGCTHYPLLRSTVGEIMGEEITLVNPAYETAKGLDELLKSHGLRKTVGNLAIEQSHDFYVSDAEEKFMEFARSILPSNIHKVNLINNIEEF